MSNTTTTQAHTTVSSPGSPLGSPENIPTPGEAIVDSENLKTKFENAIEKLDLRYWDEKPLSPHKAIGGFHTVLDPFIVSVDDVRAWYKLYGGFWTTALVLFGRKSVWKMQARVLGQIPRRGPAGGNPGDPGDDDPYDSDDDFGDGRVGRDAHDGGDYAAEEYSRLVQGESTRIGVSGSIIASVIAAALAFDSLSQTHWVARAAWVYSLASSLMAVYCANNLSWKTGYLVLGGKLRAWMSGHQGDPRWRYRRAYGSASEDENKERREQLLSSLTPSPASTLTVSAPAILLSSSLLFLFVGFGVFFGFMWERALDVAAGPDDSRDVFVVYMVSLGVCGLLFASSTTASQDRAARSTIRGVVGRNIKQAAVREQESGSRGLYGMIKSVLDGQSEILKVLVESREIMEMSNTNLRTQDHTGQTPLHWATQRGSRFLVLRLLYHAETIDPRDKHGWTPLMMAAANNQENIARDLLHAGARRSLKDNDEKTAWDIARDRGYTHLGFLSEE